MSWVRNAMALAPLGIGIVVACTRREPTSVVRPTERPMVSQLATDGSSCAPRYPPGSRLGCLLNHQSGGIAELLDDGSVLLGSAGGAAIETYDPKTGESHRPACPRLLG